MDLSSVQRSMSGGEDTLRIARAACNYRRDATGRAAI
jgi:hypothetical protein